MKRELGPALVLLLAAGCGPDPAGGDDGDSEGEDTEGGTTVVTTIPMTDDDDDDSTVGDDDDDDDGDDSTAGDDDDDDADSSSDGGSEDLNCCLAHQSPGCNEPMVEECVCDMDANCCVFGWDDVCAQAAERECMARCISGDDDDDDDDDMMGMACDETVTLEFLAEDAALDGDWMLIMSQQGEGMVAAVQNFMPAGTITFDVDVPCDDTFHVWVRWFEDGSQDDSFLATVDGEPMPEAIFEGDCMGFGGGGGMGWSWTQMNWRDQADEPCVYVEDPWTFDWAAGSHQVVYGYREAIALARIVVTNDPDYVP